jgi:hypothetical protein
MADSQVESRDNDGRQLPTRDIPAALLLAETALELRRRWLDAVERNRQRKISGAPGERLKDLKVG